jgi:EpsI family protein
VIRRSFVLMVLVLLAAGLTHRLRPVAASRALPLEGLPLALGGWQGRPAPAFDGQTLQVLGADDILHRTYVAAGVAPANVYVGYYRSQAHGRSIHSPMNCLPGAGWEIRRAERVPFARGTARRVLIGKGDERLLVMYWYETATRVEGDEYRSAAYAALDTIRTRRNDAALVRVIVSVSPVEGGEARAARQVAGLAGLLEPQVHRLLFPERPDGA